MTRNPYEVEFTVRVKCRKMTVIRTAVCTAQMHTQGKPMKFNRSRIVVLTVVLVLLVGALPTFAQSGLVPGAQPTYGSVSLSAGFVPDPYEVAVTSGGPVSARWELGSECAGYINSTPDFNVRWSGSTDDLYIGFDGSADTTLVVRTPSGFYGCSDDVYGLDPEVWIAYPQAGTYQVWVGSYRSGEFNDGILYVTEL